MNSTYRIELDGEFIGETRLERADPPMGVIGGKVTFMITEDPYSLFKRYCPTHKVTINHDEEEFGFIDTQNMDGLKVFRGDGVEIAGVPGASSSGFREDGYENTILGVPYPFYGEEFPHHREAYEKQFSRDDTVQ
ncbi:MAG: hypothetical protein ABL994_12720 [Verrucomicrobiales bacterium]